MLRVFLVQWRAGLMALIYTLIYICYWVCTMKLSLVTYKQCPSSCLILTMHRSYNFSLLAFSSFILLKHASWLTSMQLLHGFRIGFCAFSNTALPAMAKTSALIRSHRSLFQT